MTMEKNVPKMNTVDVIPVMRPNDDLYLLKMHKIMNNSLLKNPAILKTLIHALGTTGHKSLIAHSLTLIKG